MASKYPHQSRIERLVTVSQELSLARDLETVMRIVRMTARDLTGADGATFILREGDECYYADEDAVSTLWKGNRFPMRSCVSGWVMTNKKPATIEDVYADDRIPVHAYRPTFVQSMAMVPIRRMDPLGAIGTYWATRRKIAEEEVIFLQALADMTAVAIENIEIRSRLEDSITQRTRELAESLTREQDLNKVRATMLSSASHDIGTPLVAILTLVEELQHHSDSFGQPDGSRYLRHIRSEVKGLLGTLNDVLSAERFEQGEVNARRHLFDVHDLLANVIEQFDSPHNRQRRVHFSHAGRTHIFADQVIVRSIVLNLLSNAVKYSTEDVELASELTDDHLTIRVTDKGIGIPKTQGPKIFRAYFRGSNVDSVGGTGLGLYIVKQYVDLLDGTVNFTSRKNDGTTFEVRLPGLSHNSGDTDTPGSTEATVR